MDRVLVRQQERNLLRWQEAREEAVATLRQGMVSGAATSIDDVLDSLRSLGAGVRSLIGDFEELAAALGSTGCWDRERCRKGVYLLGAVPGAAATAEREEVYRLVLFNFLAMPERQRPPGEIERMLLPENRPVELRDVPIAELLVSAEEARAALQEWVDKSLAELKEELDWVERNVDAPERAAITEPLAILCDPEHLKRFKAIGSEYRTMQYRASSTFRALRKEKGAEEPARRKGDRTSAAAAVAPAPALPAPAEPMAAEVETTTTAGRIADDPQNTPIRETEVVVYQDVAERDRGIKAESGNEPSSGVAAAPVRPGPGPAAEPRTRLSRAGEWPGDGAASATAGAIDGTTGNASLCTTELLLMQRLVEREPGAERGIGDAAAPLSAFWSSSSPEEREDGNGETSPAPGVNSDAPGQPTSPWGGEYFTDERIAQIMATYRARTAAERARDDPS
jgi:hypothetical protein